MDRISIAQITRSVWPGVPGLWCRGSWRDALVAIVFSNLLVVAILTTFVWSEMIPTATWAVVCLFVATTWVIFALPQLRRELSSNVNSGTESDGKHLFRVAQTEYLRGDWAQAERALYALLDLNSDDVEARLLLATLLRRVGQPASAAQQLDRLEQTPAARKWCREIANERQQVSLVAGDGELHPSGTDALASEAA